MKSLCPPGRATTSIPGQQVSLSPTWTHKNTHKNKIKRFLKFTLKNCVVDTFKQCCQPPYYIIFTFTPKGDYSSEESWKVYNTFGYHANSPFSTPDKDNDLDLEKNCPLMFKSPGW